MAAVTYCEPLIISGAPRSGTSLLYNLFDGHSQIGWLLNEGFFFEFVYDMGAATADTWLDATRRPIDSFIAGLRDKQLIPPLHEDYRQSSEAGSMSEFSLQSDWSESRFREALDLQSVDTVDALWRVLATACLAGQGIPPKRFACLKAPDYAKSAAAAAQAIPSARAVVIIRDPVRALDSLKRSRELRREKHLSWPQFSLCIAQMQAMVSRVREYSRDRIYWIRYEDLVSDPAGTMKPLANWVGIDFEDCLLQPTMQGRDWPGISSFKSTTGIETAPAERAIQSLDAFDLDLIETSLTEFRRFFGYE